MHRSQRVHDHSVHVVVASYAHWRSGVSRRPGWALANGLPSPSRSSSRSKLATGSVMPNVPALPSSLRLRQQSLSMG